MNFAQLQHHIAEIGPRIEENGLAADATDRVSHENYAMLKELRLFSALVPEDLGGYGLDYQDMCALLRQLAAYHPSTALSCSMHQHVVAANRYNHSKGRPGQALLEKVAAAELVLVSTGGGDWLASNGELSACEGGYRLNATKHFASGSPAADILVTSAPYEDPEQGWQVLHFPVPLNTKGVSVLGNWRAMGMRGTGSNSVKLEQVFVPASSIAAKRPRGDFHMMWNVILPVALPLIMSVYLGIAESAARKARARCQNNPNRDPALAIVLGEMENALTLATISVESMIDIADNFSYEADSQTVNRIAQRKTLATRACQDTVSKAMEACGGGAYLRDTGIENLLRDVMAAHYHPMPEKRQLQFSGSLAMGLEPAGQAY